MKAKNIKRGMKLRCTGRPTFSAGLARQAGVRLNHPEIGEVVTVKNVSQIISAVYVTHRVHFEEYWCDGGFLPQWFEPAE